MANDQPLFLDISTLNHNSTSRQSQLRKIRRGAYWINCNTLQIISTISKNGLFKSFKGSDGLLRSGVQIFGTSVFGVTKYSFQPGTSYYRGYVVILTKAEIESALKYTQAINKQPVEVEKPVKHPAVIYGGPSLQTPRFEYIIATLNKNGNYEFSIAPVVHDSLDRAKAEVVRLLGVFPSDNFIIFHRVASAKKPDIIWDS